MKTKTWICLLAAVAVVCFALSLWLLRPQRAAAVEVWSEGDLIQTLPLTEDCTLPVTGSKGSNVITVKNGAVAVTEADCPDHYCVHRGFCSGGAQIVCLPNRLILRFVGKTDIDSVSG